MTALHYTLLASHCLDDEQECDACGHYAMTHACSKCGESFCSDCCEATYMGGVVCEECNVKEEDDDDE